MMASFGVIENFKVKTNQKFLDKASSLEPTLKREIVYPQRLVQAKKADSHEYCVEEIGSLESLKERKFGKDDNVVFDFGDHQVGYVSFTAVPVGSHFDAPAYLHLKFAQVPEELCEDSALYNGWLSKSWIQEEYIHIDILPTRVELPRRYAFRYLQIDVIDTSLKYALKFKDVSCDYASAVAGEQVLPLGSTDEMLNRLDEVGIKTLRDCMQSVFEDGPKRDRRLWLGDLRLQARTNYVTFKNYDLVKRCLYMFAGITFYDGRIGACFFHEPDLQVDDTYLFDYALFFGSALWDYYEASGDLDALVELYPQAMEQIDICARQLGENNVVIDKGDEFWCFLDWGEGLNKQAGAQAVFIYALRYALRLARKLGDDKRVGYLEKLSAVLKNAAIKAFWDEEHEMFASGEERQISWATQIWMVLARVFDKEKSRDLIVRTMRVNPRIRMVTPYMYHHYIDALIRCGEEELALSEMKRYWGEMLRDGADTFWELYNPYSKNESPYGGSIINSYCHAWSCTPTYLLRKFYSKNENFKHLF
jgi:hypothetical protein